MNKPIVLKFHKHHPYGPKVLMIECAKLRKMIPTLTNHEEHMLWEFKMDRSERVARELGYAK